MEKYIYVEEIAARYEVTVGTVYEWIRIGKLKAMKIGKRYYIKARDVSKMERLGVIGTFKKEAPKQTI